MKKITLITLMLALGVSVYAQKRMGPPAKLPPKLEADLKLTPEQQARFIADAPDAFKPENGAWGLQGCTAVRLDRVNEEMLGEAMTLAWRHTSEKALARGTPKRTPRSRAK